MKNKVITIQNNLQISSCGNCHDKTINDGWCANCIDVADNKYTCNPVQTDVYKILEENPRQSLIVASKTGTGKTWCAYQAIRKYYQSGGTNKIFWLNPLKQIVREKVQELELTFPDKKILELTGDTSQEIGFGTAREQYIKSSDIIVCSYEMFDSLTRKPNIYTSLNSVDMIVIDEIHSIGDHERGGKLDGAITRFLLRMQKLDRHIQVVALSATFDNLEDLDKYFTQFTNVRIVTSEFSPIKVNVDPELYTYVKDANTLFVELAGQYLKKDGGIMCMQLSIPASRKLTDLLNTVYGPNTAKAHYSELQRDDKYAIVDEFNEGKFKVLCCTPTLLCVPEGTCIIADNGFTDINNISKINKILTHSGQFQNVLSIQNKNYDNDLVVIKPQYQLAMKMSPEHKVLVSEWHRYGYHSRYVNSYHEWRKGELKWVSASDIQIGRTDNRNYVVYPRLKEIVDIETIKFSDYGIQSESYLHADTIKLSDDLMYVFGLYIADGSSSANGVVKFDFGIDAKSNNIVAELCDKISKSIPGVNVVIDEPALTKQSVRFCSKPIAELMKILFGEDAHTKRIPYEFLFLPHHKQQSLIRGMYLGDGSTEYNRKNIGLIYQYSTVSKTLINQLFVILARLGYVSSINYYEREILNPEFYGNNDVHKHKGYISVISGEQATKFAIDIMFEDADDIDDCVQKARKNRTYNLFHIDSDYIYLPIDKIYKEHYSGIVYDITVEEDNSYVGSFVVHNSGVNVAATTIILNLSFYNPLKLEPDIIPATSIRQAIGRVGRPPRYKEGWVVYITNIKQDDEAREVLQSSNIILGALNSAIHQVFNIEIHLLKQSENDLYEWYRHTYSGCSSSTSDEMFKDSIEWLIDHGYITGSSECLISTKKGNACAKHYVNPVFYENCLEVLNRSEIKNSTQMEDMFSELFSMPYSPCNWNDRKSQQLSSHFSFDWMKYNNVFNWNQTPPNVQWATQIEFALHGIAEVAKRLNVEPLAHNAELIETSMECGIIPISMAEVRLKIEKLGMPYLGHKYLIYLYMNGVSVKDGVLQGPDVFKTPSDAIYSSSTDAYTSVSFSNERSRFEGAALNLSKKYGVAPRIIDPATDEWM